MIHNYLKLISIVLLGCLPLSLRAQEGLEIERLFEKYGKEKDVTYVELNGEILDSYRMETYKSLVFRNVTPYATEIEACLEKEAQSAHVKKRQEVTRSDTLMSAYYQLADVRRRGKAWKRYILFKRGKEALATLVYIEGTLNEKELMEMLYKK